MKKNFTLPCMNISRFDLENVVTVSGTAQPEQTNIEVVTSALTDVKGKTNYKGTTEITLTW